MRLASLLLFAASGLFALLLSAPGKAESGWLSSASCASVYLLLADNRREQFADPAYVRMRDFALRERSFPNSDRADRDALDVAQYIQKSEPADGTVSDNLLGMLESCINLYHVRPSDLARRALGFEVAEWNSYWGEVDTALSAQAQKEQQTSKAQAEQRERAAAYAPFDARLSDCQNPDYFDMAAMDGGYTARQMKIDRNRNICNEALTGARNEAYKRKDQVRIDFYNRFKFGVNNGPFPD